MDVLLIAKPLLELGQRRLDGEPRLFEPREQFFYRAGVHGAGRRDRVAALCPYCDTTAEVVSRISGFRFSRHTAMAQAPVGRMSPKTPSGSPTPIRSVSLPPLRLLPPAAQELSQSASHFLTSTRWRVNLKRLPRRHRLQTGWEWDPLPH